MRSDLRMLRNPNEFCKSQQSLRLEWVSVRPMTLCGPCPRPRCPYCSSDPPVLVSHNGKTLISTSYFHINAMVLKIHPVTRYMIGVSYFLWDARLPSLKCSVVALTLVRKPPAVCFDHNVGLMCLYVSCVIHTHTHFTRLK
jgi:hypothetical protein